LFSKEQQIDTKFFNVNFKVMRNSLLYQAGFPEPQYYGCGRGNEVMQLQGREGFVSIAVISLFQE